MDIAVLFLVFNRPDTTVKVFQAIRRAKPFRLYVAADGPRASRDGEFGRCEEVRRIATAVDWPCEVKTLFRKENLGCKRAVGGAIAWFFEHEKKGIILEDDCLPNPDFFRFCEDLLETHEDNKQIFAIQGNFFGSDNPINSSYVYSKNFYMWGWASWADRWHRVDLDVTDPNAVLSSLKRRWLGSNLVVRKYWSDKLMDQISGKIDSWGYPATFHCFKNQLYNLSPNVNLVKNIGFDGNSTHTRNMWCGQDHSVFGNMKWPLVHPSQYEGSENVATCEVKWRIQIPSFYLFRRLVISYFPKLWQRLRNLRDWLAAAKASGKSSNRFHDNRIE